jgi:hypothetical protein
VVLSIAEVLQAVGHSSSSGNMAQQHKNSQVQIQM